MPGTTPSSRETVVSEAGTLLKSTQIAELEAQSLGQLLSPLPSQLSAKVAFAALEQIQFVSNGGKILILFRHCFESFVRHKVLIRVGHRLFEHIATDTPPQACQDSADRGGGGIGFELARARYAVRDPAAGCCE